MVENPTTNHNLHRPPTGSETGTDDVNWGDEVNINAANIDELLIIRDIDANTSDYTPFTDALYYATDTNQWYIGDGTNWVEIPWMSDSPDFTAASVNGDSVRTDVTSTTTQTGAYTASNFECILADASGAAFTVTLPAVATDTYVTVKKTDSSTNAVTVATPNSETIDGASSESLGSQYDSITITSDGTNYFIV